VKVISGWRVFRVVVLIPYLMYTEGTKEKRRLLESFVDTTRKYLSWIKRSSYSKKDTSGPIISMVPSLIFLLSQTNM